MIQTLVTVKTLPIAYREDFDHSLWRKNMQGKRCNSAKRQIIRYEMYKNKCKQCSFRHRAKLCIGRPIRPENNVAGIVQNGHKMVTASAIPN